MIHNPCLLLCPRSPTSLSSKYLISCKPSPLASSTSTATRFAATTTNDRAPIASFNPNNQPRLMTLLFDVLQEWKPPPVIQTLSGVSLKNARINQPSTNLKTGPSKRVN